VRAGGWETWGQTRSHQHSRSRGPRACLGVLRTSLNNCFRAPSPLSSPPSGRTFWLLLPIASVLAFNVALAEFAQAIGAGRGKQILLVCDGAGWHVSPQVQLPAGIHLHLLPPYSPELQPAERF
jgi:hypothetical protein